MPFTFVYLTAGISALSRLLRESEENSAVRYTNLNGIVSYIYKINPVSLAQGP